MFETAKLLNRRVADEVIELAEEAGEAIMEIYRSADFETTYKEDDSPLTRADLASHRILVEGLEAIEPGLPVLSEESSEISRARRQQWKTFWMIDPLDGTKEFIKQNGEFTVNVALIDDGRPVLGVVHAPDLAATYFAVEDIGAFKRTEEASQPLAVAKQVELPVAVVVSRSHLRERDEAFIEALRTEYGEATLTPKGSSLKLCLVAEGLADVYPRFGPTMEWDTAAAQCVVEQAGGLVHTENGDVLAYNKDDLLNPVFIARHPALTLP
ncbi:MAG: 3'(2'),5'-bisphosphate nucleotidase CysQ [Persicimonas sp.]